MEEDSGYLSHKSGDFKLSGFSDGSRRYLYSQSLLRISFDELKRSDKYAQFSGGFTDENDFEDFKQDLYNFHQLRAQVQKDVGETDFNDDADVDCKPDVNRFTDVHHNPAANHNSTVESNTIVNHESTVERNTIVSHSISNVAGDKVNFQLGINADDSSVTTMLSDFFDNEQSFREFDEVLDDFDKLYDEDFAVLRRLSKSQADEDLHDFRCSFSDFFDNDEDFREFERELDNLQIRRNSVLRRNSLHRVSSGDILVDLLRSSRRQKRHSTFSRTSSSSSSRSPSVSRNSSHERLIELHISSSSESDDSDNETNSTKCDRNSRSLTKNLIDKRHNHRHSVNMRLSCDIVPSNDGCVSFNGQSCEQNTRLPDGQFTNIKLPRLVIPNNNIVNTNDSQSIPTKQCTEIIPQSPGNVSTVPNLPRHLPSVPPGSIPSVTHSPHDKIRHLYRHLPSVSQGNIPGLPHDKSSVPDTSIDLSITSRIPDELAVTLRTTNDLPTIPIIPGELPTIPHIPGDLPIITLTNTCDTTITSPTPTSPDICSPHVYTQLLDEGVVKCRKKSADRNSNIEHRHRRIFEVLSYLGTDDDEDNDEVEVESDSDTLTRENAASLTTGTTEDCQYTCHHHCKTSVTLDCAAVSQTGAITPTSHNDATTVLNSPSHHEHTDSGYHSGTFIEAKLSEVPRPPSDATLTREDLKRHLKTFSEKLPGSNFNLSDDGVTFQGFIRVTLNLVRPITMSLTVHPPSIYEALTREHIVEQNTQSLSFYMPRDTVKSIHVTSKTTTKEVIAALLQKFRILDHPRKFAMYEQEFHNNKILKLRRIHNTECPITTCLTWDLDDVERYRLIMQEDETGEIEWNQFSLPELSNFLKILDKEENEYITQLDYKYRVMKRIIIRRLKELRRESALSGASEC